MFPGGGCGGENDNVVLAVVAVGAVVVAVVRAVYVA